MAAVDITQMLTYDVGQTIGQEYDQVHHARLEKQDKRCTATSEEAALDAPYILGIGAHLCVESLVVCTPLGKLWNKIFSNRGGCETPSFSLMVYFQFDSDQDPIALTNPFCHVYMYARVVGEPRL